MLYSEALRSKPKPTPIPNVRPARCKKNSPSPNSHRRMVEEDESDMDDTIANTLLAVQQLSEKPYGISQSKSKRKISSAWDVPIDGPRSILRTSSDQPNTTSVDRNTKSTPTSATQMNFENRNVPWKTVHNRRPSSQESIQTSFNGQPILRQHASNSKRLTYRSYRTFSVSEVISYSPPDQPNADRPTRSRSSPRWSEMTPAQKWPSLFTSREEDRIFTPEGEWVQRLDIHDGKHYWWCLPYSKRHGKQEKSKRKKRTTFLSLPGEIRNQIYAEVLPECRVLILRSRPNKELATLKNTWSTSDENHKRPRARLYHKLDNCQMDNGLELTTNLLLACKAVKCDIELYLYSRTTFCFDSIRVLQSFMDRASLQGLQAIQKVEISHEGYGNPELAENAIFRDKYYSQWTKVCVEAGKRLTGLKHLKINACLWQWPCDMSQLGCNSEWRDAFLQLAPRRLAKVEIFLQHTMFHNNTRLMRDVAHKLEDDMMTDEGRQDRDIAESKLVLARMEAKKAAKEAKRRAQEAKERAPTEFTITMDQIKQQKTSPVKYCNTGLDKYTRLNMVYMAPVELDQFKEKYCSGKHMK